MIEKVIVGPLETNCYIITIDNKCLIVDPGDEIDKIKNKIGDKDVLAILLTHRHFDHIGALNDLIALYNVPIYSKDNLYEKNYNIGDFTFDVIFTPGHTNDSVTYYFKKQGFMLIGDFIFKGTIGRTDLPTGNFDEMINSLNKMRIYDENIIIYPGHGDVTILGKELRNKWEK